MFLLNPLRTRSYRSPTRRRPGARGRSRRAGPLVLEALEDRCLLSGVVRSDYFLDTISTLPHYQNLQAQLDIHEVAPVYCPGEEHGPTQAAILVHGRTIDAVSAFDLQYQDYSLQESMARAGIDTFAVNFLGWGLSTRFGLDDARNASLADEQ